MKELEEKIRNKLAILLDRASRFEEAAIKNNCRWTGMGPDRVAERLLDTVVEVETLLTQGKISEADIYLSSRGYGVWVN